LALNIGSYFLQAIPSLLARTGGSHVCAFILAGGQTVTKCDKRGWGSILSKNRATSLMNDPTLTELFWPHSMRSAI